MPHASAPLTERGRLRLARYVVDDEWPLRRAAERLQVSPTTAKRWSERYRVEGAAGMKDRSSRPHHSPNRTRPQVERQVLHLRTSRRWGPARVGASTCHAILRRAGVARLAHLDRATREPIRRYEHPHPGDLVHIGIKKLGNIPDGGARLGYAYLHTAIDDHSRLAYTEILPDERQDTAAAFWQRAHAWFRSSGSTVRRVLTDNGSCYKSRLWHDTCTQLGVTVKKTRPYRPQTNGKVERFHRTMTDEWAYAKPNRSETARRAALPAWFHAYNHHRHHTALGGPPASRVLNLSGQNT
ncbi:IS481 family transposase [Micromonospora chokoriensis]|uniref:IS481 family transposase n=1 Tax=Micromonospora chokoriensis TaxID=356851 RepID=UPI0004C45463|nr:IS481 family transposase [Micromonospora chokoriensis]